MKDHAQVVSRLAAQMALKAGLPDAEVEEIRLAGLIHDIGKIHVPEYVLRKPTLLTAQEFEIMKSHAAWGAKMAELSRARGIERIVFHHHERHDGKGYPAGLAGDQIPLGARMVAVAESFHLCSLTCATKAPALSKMHSSSCAVAPGRSSTRRSFRPSSNGCNRKCLPLQAAQNERQWG